MNYPNQMRLPLPGPIANAMDTVREVLLKPFGFEPPRSILRYRRGVVIGLHLVLIPIGYLLAYAIRFDFTLPDAQLNTALLTVPLLLAARLLSFAVFRAFNGWWRYIGMYDLVELVKAVTLGSGVFVGSLFMTGLLSGLPRSVIVLEWGIALLMFGGVRFGVRWLREAREAEQRAEESVPALVVGAGNTGAGLIRQLRADTRKEVRVVGLVDDDPTKQGMHIYGVAVVGTTAELPELVDRFGAEIVVLAIPSATAGQVQRIIDRCEGLDVELKVVPSLVELLDGRARLSQLRQVRVEDLLGRPAVDTDLRPLEKDLSGKRILITGGAGSIGSELARQIAGFGPSRLILVEQAESPLYFINLELQKTHPDLDVVPVIADICETDRLEAVFAEHAPDYVFHAAAYKHGPLMEDNVPEAVRNNVLGTLNAARSAVRNGAGKFVLISTDKAVRPSSVMGATKRVAERVVLEWPEFALSATDFRAVRFGNVLGSDGSVLPLFKQQIAEGGPVTVTDPDVTRYFMTIPEAVQLVLQASALPEAAGKISILEMVVPKTILDMAENLIRLSGLEPYTEMPIVFTGLRPGEKLHEELMATAESTHPTSLVGIRVVSPVPPDGVTVQDGVTWLVSGLGRGDGEELVAGLRYLVDDNSLEFTPGPARRAFRRGRRPEPEYLKVATA